MTDTIDGMIYSLNCESCGDCYESSEGFPAQPFCPRCILAERADNLLLDAACQGGLVFTDTCGKRSIDTCALSTWEDVCEYLTERGLLHKINSRIYEIVDNA